MVEKWGFFFVPPDTDDLIGAVMFKPTPGTKKPKLGRVAVRKRVVEQTGVEAMVDLANFRFRVLDSAGAQVGGEFGGSSRTSQGGVSENSFSGVDFYTFSTPRAGIAW